MASQEMIFNSYVVNYAYSNGTNIPAAYCSDVYKDQIDAYQNGTSGESVYYDTFGPDSFYVCPNVKTISLGQNQIEMSILSCSDVKD